MQSKVGITKLLAKQPSGLKHLLGQLCLQKTQSILHQLRDDPQQTQRLSIKGSPTQQQVENQDDNRFAGLLLHLMLRTLKNICPQRAWPMRYCKEWLLTSTVSCSLIYNSPFLNLTYETVDLHGILFPITNWIVQTMKT